MKISGMYVIFGSILLCLSGCFQSDLEQELRSAQSLYDEGYEALQKENFEKASKLFKELERQHPLSSLTRQGQLLESYALYKDQKFHEAIHSLNRFVLYYPDHEDTAKAFYLKALCYYEDIHNVGKCQENTTQAALMLKEFMDKFPQSPDIESAQKQYQFILERLAASEMDVGRFYLRRGDVIAAIRRFQTVLEKYGKTNQVPEAFYRVIECSLFLGLLDEAKRAQAALERFFKTSEWYVEAKMLLERTQAKDPSVQMQCSKK